MQTLNATALIRDVTGTELVGAQGLTVEDQNKIDDVAARLCGTKVWKSQECRNHTVKSIERRTGVNNEPTS